MKTTYSNPILCFVRSKKFDFSYCKMNQNGLQYNYIKKI